MTGDEARRAILDALRAEVRRHWGEIGEREARLGKSGGYLSRIGRGAWSPPLDVLLATLEELDLEPASFFGHALDVTGEPEHFLRQLTSPARVPERYGRLAAAARRLGALDGGAAGAALPQGREGLGSQACARGGSDPGRGALARSRQGGAAEQQDASLARLAQPRGDALDALARDR